MNEILKKLCQVSGMLEMLACMQGCTVTPEMSSLLVDACEMFEGVINELAAQNTGAGKNAFGGFIRMDE